MFKFNKYTLLGVFLLSAIVSFSACIPAKEADKVQTKEAAQKEMMEMAKIVESGGSAYCKLTADDNGEIEYWIKGKKMKMKGLGFAVGMVDQEEETKKLGYMISDTKNMYMWSEGEAEGVKMKLPTEEELKEMAEDVKEWADNMPDFTSDEVMGEYEEQGYIVDCKKQNVSDSEFVPPSNIKFQDMSEMMEGAMEMGKGVMENYDQ